MRNFWLATCLLMLTSCPASGSEAPALGQPFRPNDITQWQSTVLPDGTGLPAGSGTVAAGREVYAVHCLACHGADGNGGPNDRLTGGVGTLTEREPIRTVGSFWPYATSLFDYVRRAMPYTTPGVLSDSEVYAVTAYLLAINGVIDQDTRLDATSLPRVHMPNREGFRWRWTDRGVPVSATGDNPQPDHQLDGAWRLIASQVLTLDARRIESNVQESLLVFAGATRFVPTGADKIGRFNSLLINAGRFEAADGTADPNTALGVRCLYTWQRL